MRGIWVALLALGCVAGGAVAQEAAPEDGRTLVAPMEVGQRYRYHSDLMGEDIQYRVVLPPQYDAASRAGYPVIYVLDGYTPAVLSVYSASSHLWGFGPDMPRAIVVGIPSNNRMRDYTPVKGTNGYDGEPDSWPDDTGGGAAYSRFLHEDFIPHIEAHYPTNGHRILVGHSQGGQFALMELVRGTSPFQGFVLLDPSLWYADQYALNELAAVPDGGLDIKGSVYVAVAMRGANPASDAFGRGLQTKGARYDRLRALLAAKAGPGFRWKVEDYPWDDHGSVAQPAHRAGLLFTFGGYMPLQGDNPLTAAPVRQVMEALAQHPELIEPHYAAFSRRVGFHYPPSPRLVGAAASIAAESGNHTNALVLYRMNAANFPDDENAWAELAAAAEATGDLAGAVEAYKRVLALDPANAQAAARLEALAK